MVVGWSGRSLVGTGRTEDSRGRGKGPGAREVHNSGNLSGIEKGFETIQWMMAEDRKERQQQMDLLISVMKGLGAQRPVAALQEDEES